MKIYIYIFTTTLISSNMEEKYVQGLEKIGLTKPEAKTYLALIELKEAQTGSLCERSHVPSSKIYIVLENLIKKGFASYRLKNNTKVFIPSSPDLLKHLFEEKEKNLKIEKNEILALVEELKTKKQEELPYSRYKYYEGLTGIRSIWIELTDDLKLLPKNEEVLVYSGRKSFESMLGMYEEFHRVRVKHAIRYRIILDLENRELGMRRKKQNAEVRFMHLENEAEFSIVGNKLIIQYATQKVPRAFVIEDKIFIQLFKQLFYQIWHLAKK